MNRRNFLKIAAAGAACSLAPKSFARANETTVVGPKRPNVLFLICDDLNAVINPVGGHPQVHAPNIRRLMERGTCFLNAQTNCPLCAPSRASLFTGLYPHTTGDFGYKQGERPWRKNPVMRDCVTMFGHFRANGYRVYGAGKLMHDGQEDLPSFESPDGGTRYRGVGGHGPYPWDGRDVTRKDGVPHPRLPKGFAMASDGRTKWDSNFGPIEHLGDEFGPNGGWILRGKPWRFESEDDRDRLPDERVADFGERVLGEAREEPFFLGLGFYRPHTPLHAPKRYFDLFPLDTLEPMRARADDLADCARILGVEGAFGTHPVGFGKYDEIMRAGGARLLLRWTQAYLACVAAVDDQVGRVLDALARSPAADNTLVVLTSDHGYHMGQKKQVFKNSPWEEANHIPMIVAGPGVAAGRQCAQPVSNIDLFPTLVDYCGLPKNPNHATHGVPLDGHSMRPLMQQTPAEWTGPKIALSAVAAREPLKPNEPGDPERQFYSVRSERYRYIICPNGEEELYDHAADPHEWTNIAADPDHASAKKELREAWRALLEKSRRPNANPRRSKTT